MAADMVLPAAASFRGCSEDLAELSLATGFTISSRVATAGWDRAMLRHTQAPNLPRRQTVAATTSLEVTMTAARELRGTIPAAQTQAVATGAAAMAVEIGAVVVVTGAGAVETAGVGDLGLANVLR
jgi:hypothetical protein